MTKKGKVLTQIILNIPLQPVLSYIVVLLPLEEGELEEISLSPFDSQREREQKKREAGYEPSRLRDWLLVFPAVEWEQRVRRGDCYVKNRFDSHTLSPIFVPLLNPPSGVRKKERITPALHSQLESNLLQNMNQHQPRRQKPEVILRPVVLLLPGLQWQLSAWGRVLNSGETPSADLKINFREFCPCSA